MDAPVAGGERVGAESGGGGAAEDTTGAAPGGAEARELPRGASWGFRDGEGVGGYPLVNIQKAIEND